MTYKESPAPNRGPIAAALYAAEAEKEAARACARRNYGSARVRVPAPKIDADAIFMRGMLAGFAIGTVPVVMLGIFFLLEG